MRMLLVEDQIKLATNIKKGLENMGYAVDMLHDGASAYRRVLASPKNFDLIILDIMLPEIDGLTLCEKIRQENISTPILMLTAKDTLEDKINGLNAGADDYIIKPFEFDELTARIRAILRRPKENIDIQLSGAGIILDTNNRIVFVDQKKVDLTLKEYTVLEYFLRNKNKVLKRNEIINHVWDYDYDAFSNIVDVHIKNLRKKINDKNGNILETIHGIGYKFNAYMYINIYE